MGENTHKTTRICFLHVEDSLIEEATAFLSNKHDISCFKNIDNLIELLKTKNQQYVIIIGANTDSPVHLAITLNKVYHMFPVFIIAQMTDVTDLTRELKFNPFASTNVCLLTTQDWPKLPELIDNAIELSQDLTTKLHELCTASKEKQAVIDTKHNALCQHMPFGVIISKTNGSICYTNDKAILYLGISENTHQNSILDVFHQDEHIKLSYLILKTIQQEHVDNPIVFSTQSKLKFFSVTSCSNTSLNNEVYLYLFLHDVSEQIQSEIQLITQNTETQAILDSIPAVILCANNTGHIKYSNISAKHLFNKHYSEIKGRHLEELLPIMKEYPDIITTCLQKKIATTIESIPTDIFGADQCVDISFSPYFGCDVSGVTIKLENITERLTKIEEKVKTEKAISIACLSIGIAHSINNPLSGISIALTNINNRLFKRDEYNIELAKSCGCSLEQIESYMNQQNITKMHYDILEQVHRMSTIIKNTLFFGSTSIERPMDNYNIDIIIKNSIYMAKTEKTTNKQLLFENIEIVTQLSEGSPLIKCNQIELSLALYHLLKNAGESLARVKLIHHKPIIHIRTYFQDQTYFIEIEDNGDGIKANSHSKIFEPFFSTDCKLAGLGLAICQSIIEHHHKGKIYPKKKVKHGAVFVIELPMINVINNK